MEQPRPSTPALETKFLPSASSPLRSPTPSMMSSPGGVHSGPQRSRSRPRLPAGPRNRQQRPKDTTRAPAAPDAPADPDSPPAQVARWSSTSSSTGAPSNGAPSRTPSQSHLQGPRTLHHVAAEVTSEPGSPHPPWSSSSSSAGVDSRPQSESISPPAYSARASGHNGQQPMPTPAPAPDPVLDPDLAYAYNTLALADYEAPRQSVHSQSQAQLRLSEPVRAPSPQPMSAVSMAPRIPTFFAPQAPPQQHTPSVQPRQTSTPPPTPPSNTILASSDPASASTSTTPTPSDPAPIPALGPAPVIAPKASPAKQATPLPNLPAPSFEPPPLPNAASYKPLTLDAAQWTLSSAELQALVSAAIRESATERFIRLLPPHVVHGGRAPDSGEGETDPDDGRAMLERDLEQAEGSRRTAHARWRFEFGRRRMVLQSLAALANSGDADTSALVAQLAQSAAATDAQAAALVHAHAHEAALAHLRDTHRASALAVALRKLNASYARRTRELAGARERVGTLEGEIEEAWRMAEEVALEVDRLRTELEGYRQRETQRVDAGVQTEESAPLDAAPPVESAESPGVGSVEEVSAEDESWEEATVDGLSIISQDLTMVSRAQVVDVMGTAIVSQARLTTVDNAAASPPRVASPEIAPLCTPMTASVPPTSATSAMAVEDERTGTHARSASMPVADRRLSGTSQLSRVTAARKRSMRASKASLRMPRGWTRAEGQSPGQASRGHSRSKSRRRSLSAERAERPPVPDLPAEVETSVPARASSSSDVEVEVEADDGDGAMSFLDMHMESRSKTPALEDEDDEKVTMEDLGQEIIAPPRLSGSVHPYSAGLTTPRPPRSPTTPTLLSSFASPRSPASHSTSSLAFAAPTTSSQGSGGARISHTSHGSTGKGKGKAFAHMSAMSLFGHTLGTEEDEDGDEVSEMGGLLARRGNSLDLPAGPASVGRASILKRSMSELLRLGKGRGRRRSVPIPSSLGTGAVGVRADGGTVA